MDNLVKIHSFNDYLLLSFSEKAVSASGPSGILQTKNTLVSGDLEDE